MKDVVKILPWDSRFFRRKIALLCVRRLSPRSADKAIRFCRTQRVKCLYYLAAAKDTRSILCAENHGFHLADIRMTFAKTLSGDLPASSGSSGNAHLSFRAARRSDVPALRRLAAGLFLDSRFAVDPHFGLRFTKRLFSTWIAKSVEGHFDHWVGVALHHTRPIGFVSCRRVGRWDGRIGLLGVSPSFSRRGVGSKLLEQAEMWFHSQGIRTISVTTQARAIAAQACYQACGYRTSEVALWYHKWF